MTEPKISINGTSLTDAQAMTLRVAVTDLHSRMSNPGALGEDETGEGIRVCYVARSREIADLMLTPPPETHMAPSKAHESIARIIGDYVDLSDSRYAQMLAYVLDEVPEQAPEKNVEGTLEEYFERQIDWSRETFGPALRTGGVLDHIRKELREIEADPHDLSEWVDVVILAMDGFWRHGGKASDLLPALLAKQRKNMARTWPDWRTMSENSAIEHDRSHDAAPTEGSTDG